MEYSIVVLRNYGDSMPLLCFLCFYFQVLEIKQKGSTYLKIYFYSWNAFFRRRYPHILLTMASITALLLGISCAHKSHAITASLMGGCCKASVSIVRLAFALLLPFLAVFLAALYSNHTALIPVCAFKVFAFSFCGTGISLTCPSASWIICGLLMLSDGLSLLLLLRLCFRHIGGFRSGLGAELVTSMLLTVGISVLDCIYIAPFLVRILNC